MKFKPLLLSLLLSAFVIFVIMPFARPVVFLSLVAVILLSARVGGIKYGLFSLFLMITGSYFILGGSSLPWYVVTANLSIATVVAVIILYVQKVLIERKKTLEVEKYKLQVLSDSITDALVTINDKSNIVFANPSTYKMFGLSDESLVGRSLTNLMPKELRPKHMEGFNRYLASNSKTLDWRAVQATGLKSDGTEFPIEISFGEYKDGGNRYFSAVIRDVTERHIFEKNRAQLAQIVESSNDAIISKDLNSIITSWNLGAEEMFGYTSEEIVGQSITKLFPDDMKSEEEFIMGEIKKGEKIKHYETFRVRKNGEVFPVSVTVSPLRDSKGVIIGASKIARDFSEMKAYEKKIKESEERYKAFVANSTEGIWRFELKEPIDINLPVDEQVYLLFERGYLAECNDAMANMYGYEKGTDLEGVSVYMMMPKNEINMQYLKTIIENGYKISEAESCETDKDNNVKYFMNSLTGYIENGKLIRGWGVQRDVTSKKLQAEEIERSKERYQNFIKNSDEGICRIELDEPMPVDLPVMEQMDWIITKGRIVEANELIFKIYNAENPEEILNKPLSSLTDRTPKDDVFMRLFVEQDYSISNFESNTLPNEKGDVHYRSTSMKGMIKDGYLKRMWVIQRDITSQKHYTFEREKLLKEATEARIEAELANQEKDRFLANLSHELRTPLVSILGYSSLLKDSTEITDLSNGIKIINKNALLQLDLIEDLLDVSRIVSGKIKLNKELFTLGEVFENGIEMLKPKAIDKDLKIKYKCDGLPVFADKKRMGQIFSNLLGNAIKFTDKGEIDISCGKDDNNFWFTVKDTGVGISSENIPKLFKQFTQLDSSSTKKKQGLGLGLSIVKNLVSLHGGGVEVSSKVGTGSEFKVTIPMDSYTTIDEVEVNDSFEGLNLLVIEDDVDTGELLKSYLERKGGTVEVRNNVKDALLLIEKTKFDLYICDLAMPDEDGLSLIKKIRLKGDKTPSVALTAYVDYKDLALRSGFDFFMSKPVKFEEFSLIRSLVKD